MKTAAPLQDTRPGNFIDGGLYAGTFGNYEPYVLILAPKATGECEDRWTFSPNSIEGTQSRTDGQANTIAMAEAGLPLGKWAAGLVIDGFDDWYIPSSQEQQFLGDRFAGMLHDRVRLDPAEGFDPIWYLSSTEDQRDPRYVYAYAFGPGQERQAAVLKCNVHRVRAVRRVPIN